MARQHHVPEQTASDPKNPPLHGPAGLVQAVAGPDLENPPLRGPAGLVQALAGPDLLNPPLPGPAVPGDFLLRPL